MGTRIPIRTHGLKSGNIGKSLYENLKSAGLPTVQRSRASFETLASSDLLRLGSAATSRDLPPADACGCPSSFRGRCIPLCRYLAAVRTSSARPRLARHKIAPSRKNTTRSRGAPLDGQTYLFFFFLSFIAVNQGLTLCRLGPGHVALIRGHTEGCLPRENKGQKIKNTSKCWCVSSRHVRPSPPPLRPKQDVGGRCGRFVWTDED